MLSPGLAFAAGSAFALISWICLSASLFVPQSLRVAVWNGTTIGVPSMLGVPYATLLFRGLRERRDVGFRSVEAVRQLFISNAALASRCQEPS